MFFFFFFVVVVRVEELSLLVCVRVLQDVFDHLKTPGNKPQQGEGAETPLSEVIERNLKAAVANSNRSHVMSLAALTASPQLGKKPEPKLHEQVYIPLQSCPLCANVFCSHF